jgi:hypothetical protein
LKIVSEKRGGDWERGRLGEGVTGRRGEGENPTLEESG